MREILRRVVKREKLRGRKLGGNVEPRRLRGRTRQDGKLR
jgi:hypothetical protein